MLDFRAWNAGSVAFTVVWTAMGIAMGVTMGTALGLLFLFAYLAVPVLLAVGEATGHIRLTDRKEAA